MCIRDRHWDNGKYICRDGILTEVVSNRHNVYKVRKIARKEIEYLITDGNGNWAHGDTLEEAKEDLMYKISDRRKSDYKHLKIDDTLPVDEAIKCYRVITGEMCIRDSTYCVIISLNSLFNFVRNDLMNT